MPGTNAATEKFLSEKSRLNRETAEKWLRRGSKIFSAKKTI